MVQADILAVQRNDIGFLVGQAFRRELLCHFGKFSEDVVSSDATRSLPDSENEADEALQTHFRIAWKKHGFTSNSWSSSISSL